MIRNGQSIPLANVPVVATEQWRAGVLENLAKPRGRLWALMALPCERLGAAGSKMRLFAVCGDDTTGMLSVASTDVAGEYPALTPDCPQAHLFEREIFEQWGCHPRGHPWLKPVRFQKPFNNPQAPAPAVGECDFFRVEGEEIHEVAVGPVHAGIIEPGHFRFQCHGEDVHHLEISFGYQHRGIESRLAGPVTARTAHYIETIAGDTSIGHSLAYALACESLSGTVTSERAEALRAIMLELERCANHTGDLGALAGDVAFLPTLSYCGRLRGDFLNMSALVCGNRFGRNMVRPGGVRFDLDSERRQRLLIHLDSTLHDTRGAVDLLWRSGSVMNRFEDTGTIDRQICRDLGVVGVAARASGLEGDVRVDYPHGAYRATPPKMASSRCGDVLARAQVRWQEIEQSAALVQTLAEKLPEGPASVTPAPLRPSHLTVSLVEAWRGPVCHVAITDKNGGFAWYKPVDPSVHNWRALAMALRGQQISDFPLCNKSFNLSYCGFDL